jgi:surface glycoprotein (TIGR04207 family)
MTGTKDKLRSLFLAALMVTSVFGATVAFSGAAAAANTAQGASVSPNTAQSGNTATHTFEFTATDVQSDGDTDTIDVTLPLGEFDAAPDTGDVSVTTANNDNIPVDDTSLVNNGQTVRIAISPSV